MYVCNLNSLVVNYTISKYIYISIHPVGNCEGKKLPLAFDQPSLIKHQLGLSNWELNTVIQDVPKML